MQRKKKVTRKFLEMNSEQSEMVTFMKEFMTEKIILPEISKTNLVEYRAKLEKVLENFTCDMQTGLYFGFVEGDLLLDCLDLRDKKQ